MTGPGFIVLACVGQRLMQAQHVMHLSASAEYPSSGSMAPVGHPSAQVPHRIHPSPTSIKSTVQSFESPR